MIIYYILFLGFLLQSCQDNRSENTTLFSENVMTIDYRIIVGKNLSRVEKDQVKKIINQTFDEVNAIYNKWNPSSELSKINALPADHKVQISANLYQLLVLTDRVVKLTEGLFDPTIEPLQQLWKRNLEQNAIPSNEQIAEISPSIGWDKIHFTPDQFWKDNDQTQIDLGGIAKGYCVDLLVERLNAIGLKDLFVEWGGEIRTSGLHPDNRPWTIYISNLSDSNPEHAITQLYLTDMAIATSGDYLQNWTVKSDGQQVTFFHILHPKLQRPLIASHTSIASASIQAPTCAVADGIATAVMMFSSLQEGQIWLQELQKEIPELKGWLISRKKIKDGKQNDQNTPL